MESTQERTNWLGVAEAVKDRIRTLVHSGKITSNTQLSVKQLLGEFSVAERIQICERYFMPYHGVIAYAEPVDPSNPDVPPAPAEITHQYTVHWNGRTGQLRIYLWN